MKDSNGWDGKLRVGQRAEITNPEAMEGPEYSDPEAPSAEEIEADEGMYGFLGGGGRERIGWVRMGALVEMGLANGL